MLRRVVRLRVNEPTWIDRRTMSRAVALAVVGTAVLGALLWWLLVAVDGWADQARPATCLATRCFCEAVRDAPVAQPANTVSSLAYVLVGLWAAAAAAGARRATARSAGALIPWLALVVALVGLSSAFYHATLTFLGQYFDVLSMYLLGALLLCGALVRMGALRPPAAVVLFVAIAGSLAVAQYAYPESRRVLFALVLLPGILLEARPGTSGLPWRDPRRVPLWTGIGLLVVAYGLWVLDDREVLCWPPLVDDDTAARLARAPATPQWDALYFGNLNTPNNVDAVVWWVGQVLPLLPGPELRFAVAGSRPSATVREIVSRDSRVTLLADPPDLAERVAAARTLVISRTPAPRTRMSALPAPMVPSMPSCASRTPPGALAACVSRLWTGCSKSTSMSM